jgi:hypothetical protein
MPNRNGFFAAFLALAASPAMLFCVPARAQESCKLALDAQMKTITTPTHVYSTTTAAYTHNVPQNSEMIYTGGSDGTIFVMARGKWIRSPLSPAEMVKQQEENRRTNKVTCKFLRDEPVSGEVAAVYTIHEESPDAKIDATIWVSKSKGLPIKEDMDMDVGGGAVGKTHRTMRYEYTNVKPPLM